MNEAKENRTIVLRPEGRPKEDLTSLPEGWQDHILNLYLVGASNVEIKAEIIGWRGRFSNNLWYRWLTDYEEFREIIEMGKILSEAFYMKIGRENLKNNQFNSVMYIWQTRNRFGWNEKGTDKVEIPVQTIDYSKLSTGTLRELIKAKTDGATRS